MLLLYSSLISPLNINEIGTISRWLFTETSINLLFVSVYFVLYCLVLCSFVFVLIYFLFLIVSFCISLFINVF